MQNKNLILDCGEIIKLIISFIRNTRNKYNIPKDKLVLYINILNKNLEIMDLQIIKWEKILLKHNMGNLKRIEYSTNKLFEKNIYFEFINIKQYNVYLELPTIKKETQINEFICQIKKLENLKIKFEYKLSNKKFILNAPENIINNNKKLIDVKNKIETLKTNIKLLNNKN